MKSLHSIDAAIFICMAVYSCTDSPASQQPDLKGYLTPKDTGLQTGGVKMIQVETAKGRFNV
jgi:hypothetical protein